MTKKIESLTEAQTASMPRFVDKWLKIGLATSDQPIDRDICREALDKSYAACKLPPPKYIIYLDGPTIGNKAANYSAEILAMCESGQLDPNLSQEETWNVIKTIPLTGKIEIISPSMYGSQNAGGLAFYDFFNEHFGLAKEIEGPAQLALVAGWVWTYNDLAIVTARPTKVVMLDKLLHCETGAAIEYKDGTKIYSAFGSTLPENWVLNKDTIDPSVILSEENVETRTAGIKLIGYAKMKHALNYTIIEGDPATDIGALVSLRIPDLPRPGLFLDAMCPRNGNIFLGVPPVNPVDGKSITTAIGAQAFLARLPTDAYAHPKIRT